MGRTDRALFLSLKPRYAELILDGDKTVELRRIRPRAEPGTLAVIYASTPVRAVLGTCVVEEIGIETPELTWNLHGAQTGLHRDQFDAYFQDRSLAVAISVGRPRRLRQPIALQDLRQGLDSFSPPQSFRYLTPDQAIALIPDEWIDHCNAQEPVLAT